MAFEQFQIKIPGLVAGSDLSAASNQYRYVKMTGANQIGLCAAVTDVPIGVLQNLPKSGKSAEVCALGVTKLRANGALAVGELVGTSSDAEASPYVPGTDTTKYITGQVLTAATAAGGYATAVVNCINPARGA